MKMDLKSVIKFKMIRPSFKNKRPDRKIKKKIFWFFLITFSLMTLGLGNSVVFAEENTIYTYHRHVPFVTGKIKGLT